VLARRRSPVTSTLRTVETSAPPESSPAPASPDDETHADALDPGRDPVGTGEPGEPVDTVDTDGTDEAGDGPAPPRRTPVEVARAGWHRLREDRGLCVVLGAVGLWCAVMYLYVWYRHERFGTFDNDLGFHDQYVWLLARGQSFSTVLGLPPFGHNATFGYVLLVPFSWLGLGPHGLNLINTVAVGLGAVPLYLLARDRFGDQWKAVPFGLVWLLHPVVQGNVWETFHPDALAMAPLLAAYLCASRRRWRPFAAFLVLALIWKSDVSLAVVMLGAVVLLWSRRPDRPALDRRIGAATVALGLVWFAFTVGWMIPHLSGGGTVFGPLYGDLGETPMDVAGTAVSDPGKVAGRMADHEPVRYARDLLAPYGFVPVLGGPVLLLGAPQAVVNLLSEQSFTREWLDNAHYQALPVVALSLALVEGVAWIDRRRPGWGRPVTTFVLATSLGATVAWGSLPPLATQAGHFWQAEDPVAEQARQSAIDAVPPDATVTAHYLLVPHLTHREKVYSFPNPWRRVFYGVKGTPLPDPATVDYLVVDTPALNETDLSTWQCIIDAGSFRVITDDQGIVVAQRIPGRTEDRACQDQT
jgi:uncharacterized membrane protein